MQLNISVTILDCESCIHSIFRFFVRSFACSFVRNMVRLFFRSRVFDCLIVSQTVVRLSVRRLSPSCWFVDDFPSIPITDNIDSSYIHNNEYFTSLSANNNILLSHT